MGYNGRNIWVEASFRRSPKRAILEARLGAEGVLAIMDLWLAASEECPDGYLVGKSDDWLEAAAGWDVKNRRGEFLAAISQPDCLWIEWVEYNGAECYHLHDWEKHQKSLINLLNKIKAGSLGGIKSGQSRSKQTPSRAQADAKQTRSRAQANANILNLT